MSDTSSSNSTGVAVGASLAVIIVLAAVGGLAVYLRRRRTNFVELQEPESGGRRSQVLDRSHPASRVTPFTPGREQDAPRFNHRPGEDMRIARRRSDGGWDFSMPLPSISLLRPSADDPNFISPYPYSSQPYANSTTALSTSSACPSPTASTFTLVGSARTAKDKKTPGELTTLGFIEEVPPPPAYSPKRPVRDLEMH